MAVGANTAAAIVAGTAAAVVMAGGAAVAVARPGLEPLVGGGEDCLTLGQKLCPPCFFTMAGLVEERRWRGWEEVRCEVSEMILE